MPDVVQADDAWYVVGLVACLFCVLRYGTSGIKMVDEERMRPGHWLWSVSPVYFSALTLMVG